MIVKSLIFTLLFESHLVPSRSYFRNKTIYWLRGCGATTSGDPPLNVTRERSLRRELCASLFGQVVEVNRYARI